MRAVLPGEPPSKLQAFSTGLWDGFRIVVSRIRTTFPSTLAAWLLTLGV